MKGTHLDQIETIADGSNVLGRTICDNRQTFSIGLVSVLSAEHRPTASALVLARAMQPAVPPAKIAGKSVERDDEHRERRERRQTTSDVASHSIFA